MSNLQVGKGHPGHTYVPLKVFVLLPRSAIIFVQLLFTCNILAKATVGSFQETFRFLNKLEDDSRDKNRT